ncbi:MAG: PEP-CTERM sorting domain-containing protein [Oscillatoriales cyanobacterium C42_A2020_001]|nr:PEP-CTERM sorting domain-containing protein [Leptolyngbyaceae cyanobacterium C42_A2020_001]
MKSILDVPQTLPAALAGFTLLTLCCGFPTSAATFTPEPLFETSSSYTTAIPRTDGGSDPASIYYPVVSGSATVPENLPIALLLQGALVNQTNYSNFAGIVAQYGFAVVVPNHFRTLVDPVVGPFPGLFPEQQQVLDVLAFLKTENTNATAPIAGQLNTSQLGLLGHSFGGAVGLAAVQNTCVPILCTGSYTRPPELKAGAFYGASFFDPRFQNTIPAINNQEVPVALIAGSKDGVTDLADVEATYNQIQELPKTLITVIGANHYGITNTDNPVRDPIRPTLEQSVATEAIARWSALFLRANILGDEQAFNYIFNTGDALDPNVTTTAAVPEPGTVVGIILFTGGVLSLKRQSQQTRIRDQD